MHELGIFLTRQWTVAVAFAITKLLKPLVIWVHTLTANNGRKYTWYQEIARVLTIESGLLKCHESEVL